MDWGQLITTAVPVFVALAAGFWAWLSGRKKGSADTQEKINAGFQLLVNQLQEERTLFANESMEQRMEMRTLVRHIKALEAHISALEQLLREHRIDFTECISQMPRLDRDKQAPL